MDSVFPLETGLNKFEYLFATKYSDRLMEETTPTYQSYFIFVGIKVH